MHRLLLTFLLLPIIASAVSISQKEVDNSLITLDKMIKHRNTYIAKREATIDSLRHRLHNATDVDQSLELTLEIGELFSSFNNDSSLIYFTQGYDRALQLGRNREALIFRAKRAANLPLSGFVHDGYAEFESINFASVPDDLMPFYYEAGRQLCSYISAFYKGNASGRYWQQREWDYLKQFLALNPTSDQLYTINLASDLIYSGKLSQAYGLLEDYIATIPENSNLYARACHLLSYIAGQRGDITEQLYYLAQSAIADLSAAVLEVTALQELGTMMHASGQINRAYNYLSTALLNSVECHASVRMLETSSALPIIQQSHNEQVNKWRSRIYLVIVLLCFTLGLVVFALIYLRHQIKRTAMLKDRLQSANQLKDIYISQFFQLSSIYVDKMNQLCKIVNRKISTGKIDELYKITKSNKFVEEQTQDFYDLFDHAFLNMYPGFIDRVNELLNDKIVLKEGELLNNDLRILAFMRLGLDDTNQVAQILNYSVNTIYAYRNKLRNRAIDRDNFERDIMAIPSI